MQRLVTALIALLLATSPGAFARARGSYPGWFAERALRGCGCTNVKTTLTLALDAPATALTGLEAKLLASLRVATAREPGLVVRSTTVSRDGSGTLTVILDGTGPASEWYLSLQRACRAAGRSAPIHVVVTGSLAEQPTVVDQATIARDITAALLGRVINRVQVTPSLAAVSGCAALIPAESAAGSRGNYTIALADGAGGTQVSINLPGLR
jgi:hypothetical protein